MPGIDVNTILPFDAVPMMGNRAAISSMGIPHRKGPGQVGFGYNMITRRIYPGELAITGASLNQFTAGVRPPSVNKTLGVRLLGQFDTGTGYAALQLRPNGEQS